MNETKFQSTVTNSILNRKTDTVNLAITDNEKAIIITVDKTDAAYTADEARELADEMEVTLGDSERVVEYIRDMADILDNEATAIDIQQKWEEKGKQTQL